MQFCDEILPPPNRHLFWNLNDDEQELPALKQIGPTTDLPQGEHQAQGAAASQKGSACPGRAACPGGEAY
jgi:hypothetical protein